MYFSSNVEADKGSLLSCKLITGYVTHVPAKFPTVSLKPAFITLFITVVIGTRSAELETTAPGKLCMLTKNAHK